MEYVEHMVRSLGRNTEVLLTDEVIRYKYFNAGLLSNGKTTRTPYVNITTTLMNETLGSISYFPYYYYGFL